MKDYNELNVENVSMDYRELRGLVNKTHARFSEINFDESLSLLQKVNLLAEHFKEVLKDFQNVVDYLDKFIDEFDENLYETTFDVLNKWLVDGTLEKLINETALKNIKDDVDLLKSTKADIVFVNALFSSLVNGNFSGVFKTYQMLVKTYPNGTKGIFLVEEDNGIYWFDDEIKKWVFIDYYQPLEIPLDSITTWQTDFVETISKNLVNPQNIKDGFFVNGNDGTLNPLANYSYVYVRVKPNTNYIKNNDIHFALYDKNMNFIRGSVQNTVFTTPSNCEIVGLSLLTNQKRTFFLNEGDTLLGYDKFIQRIKQSYFLNPDFKLYEGKINIDTIKGIVDCNLRAIYNYWSPQEQRYQHSSKEIKYTSFIHRDYFLNKMSLTKLGTFKVEPYDKPIVDGDMILALYDIRYNYLITPYEDFFTVNGKPYKKYVTPITVDKNSEINTLHKAIKLCVNTHPKNRFEIYINDGEYNAFQDFSRDEIISPSFNGLALPDYVDIIGESKDKTIIACDLTGYPTETQARVSLINLRSVNKIKNATFRSQGTRYTIHDDWTTLSIPEVKELENVDVVKFGTGGLVPAFGSGHRSNATKTFKNCIFNSTLGVPFSVHNYKELEKPSKITFYDCSFECSKIVPISGQYGRYSYSAEFLSENSGVADVVEMFNCSIPRGIISLPDEWSGLNPDKKLDYRISGSGNSRETKNTTIGSDDGVFFINMKDEFTSFLAGDPITKGDSVKVQYRGSVLKCEPTDVNAIGVAENSGVPIQKIYVKRIK